MTLAILFLAFGLAIASIEGLPLWIPENGFASLNLPLTADQRGSLSTRTTHPLFLEQLARLATAAGAHAVIENPLSAMTKGEMFARVAELVGRDAASDFLSATHSCGHTGHRNFQLSPLQHCGVCFGCLLRCASFLTADVKDQTNYLSALPPLDLHAHIDVGVPADDLHRLAAVIFAATRSLAEAPGPAAPRRHGRLGRRQPPGPGPQPQQLRARRLPLPDRADSLRQRVRARWQQQDQHGTAAADPLGRPRRTD